MATVTDVLETVFRATGTEQYKGKLNEAAATTSRLAKAQSLFNQGLNQLGGVAGIATAALAAYGAALAYSLKLGGDYEATIYRTSLLLKNLGTGVPIQAVERFAQAQTTNAEASERSVIQLYGLLATVKLTDQQIRAVIPSLINFSKYTGSLERSAELVTSALRGEKDAIQRYGIDLKVTGDQARDLAEIQKQIDERFRGAAAGWATTLPGAFERLAISMEKFGTEFGRAFSPSVVALVNAVADAFLLWARNMDKVILGLELLRVLPIGTFLSYRAAVRQAQAEDAGGTVGAQTLGAMGAGSNNTQERTARASEATAANTKKLAEGASRAIVGGGSLASGALNIRRLNAALRATR